MSVSDIIGIVLCIWTVIICVLIIRILIVICNSQDKKAREAKEAEDEKIRQLLLKRLEEKQKKD